VDKSEDIELKVLTSMSDIEPYRHLWCKLCRHRNADLDFFQFILSTRSAAPYVLLVRDGAETALVVGRIETTRLENWIGYFRVLSPRLRVLELIHGGFLGEIESKLARAVATHLRGVVRRAEVDAIRLNYANVTSPLFVEFANMRRFHARRHSVRAVPHRFRHVGATSTSFGDSISSHARSHQRRREKRLLAEYRGDVRIESYSSIESLPRLIKDAEHVAFRSYQRGLGVGFTLTESIPRPFEWLAEQGWLRAWILYLGGRPAAFWIGALREGTFLSEYMAYDPEVSHLRPGTYLTMKVLEEMQDKPSGVRLIDFGLGDAEYKERFGTEVQMIASLHVFALTWRGLCASMIDTGANLATSLARAALASFGALDRVKRRQRAAAVADAG
jgi:hypothetical protein